MRRTVQRALLATLLVFATTDRARAEPFTATYLVHLTEVATHTSRTPIDLHINVMLTIDPARPSVGVDNPNWIYAEFSEFPLGPALPEGLVMVPDDRIARHGAALTAAGWTQAATAVDARSGVAVLNGQNTLYWTMTEMSLFVEGLPARPEISWETFFEHLSFTPRANLAQNFTYRICIEPGRLTPTCSAANVVDAVFYSGQATLIDVQAPVPEPATLALVGTGLAGLVARRRQKRRGR